MYIYVCFYIKQIVVLKQKRPLRPPLRLFLTWLVEYGVKKNCAYSHTLHTLGSLTVHAFQIYIYIYIQATTQRARLIRYSSRGKPCIKLAPSSPFLWASVVWRVVKPCQPANEHRATTPRLYDNAQQRGIVSRVNDGRMTKFYHFTSRRRAFMMISTFPLSIKIFFFA